MRVRGQSVTSHKSENLSRDSSRKKELLDLLASPESHHSAKKNVSAHIESLVRAESAKITYVLGTVCKSITGALLEHVDNCNEWFDYEESHRLIKRHLEKATWAITMHLKLAGVNAMNRLHERLDDELGEIREIYQEAKLGKRKPRDPQTPQASKILPELTKLIESKSIERNHKGSERDNRQPEATESLASGNPYQTEPPPKYTLRSGKKIPREVEKEKKLKVLKTGVQRHHEDEIIETNHETFSEIQTKSAQKLAKSGITAEDTQAKKTDISLLKEQLFGLSSTRSQLQAAADNRLRVLLPQSPDSTQATALEVTRKKSEYSVPLGTKVTWDKKPRERDHKEHYSFHERHRENREGRDSRDKRDSHRDSRERDKAARSASAGGARINKGAIEKANELLGQLDRAVCWQDKKEVSVRNEVVHMPEFEGRDEGSDREKSPQVVEAPRQEASIVKEKAKSKNLRDSIEEQPKPTEHSVSNKKVDRESKGKRFDVGAALRKMESENRIGIKEYNEHHSLGVKKSANDSSMLHRVIKIQSNGE